MGLLTIQLYLEMAKGNYEVSFVIALVLVVIVLGLNMLAKWISRRFDVNKGDSMTMENKIEARHLNLYYGQKHALKDVSLDIKENKITAFIGPSGCGKSTFLKTLNRMNDYVDNVKIEGDVILDGEDIYDSRVDTTLLRKKVGMVFQQPNPFPMSIYDNVAYGPRIHGIKNKKQLDKIVEDSLKAAALLHLVMEFQIDLHSSALGLIWWTTTKIMYCPCFSCTTRSYLIRSTNKCLRSDFNT